MGIASERVERDGQRYKRVALVMGALAVMGIGGTAVQWHRNSDMKDQVDQLRLSDERVQAEKLSLEKTIADLGERIVDLESAKTASEAELDRAQRQASAMAADVARTRDLSARNARAAKEIAELKRQRQDLEVALAALQGNDSRMRDELARTTRDRDSLSAQLSSRNTARDRVNNLLVDAVRGRKGRLTVVARRAKEIRVAFDMPRTLAQGAGFRITAPDGTVHTGTDAEISLEHNQGPHDATAAVQLMPDFMGPEQAVRVHLKHKPKDKLEPGTYRIDVLTSGEYMNSVLVNLR